ncbi:hypothetical protein PHSY_006790 [Pseudozyma hubeiensis SY62]|uniref:Uncharacterized protein n=1 Tax=Pseudozyma hubeiensis (strain SY62) TaxID=1305764 RepID=R9PM37_PSEHS|nr:hypothetical protein PHSY_006790 [Pseudozyma hubeiensis SY62]GAC99190.1 hypothetical protein PHSY_006790 [Pseudozyma hubeiensis SY62]
MRIVPTSCILLILAYTARSAIASSKPACPRSKYPPSRYALSTDTVCLRLLPISAATTAATLECRVQGDESPEAALRQVDEHAIRSMYCALGCDSVVNNRTRSALAPYVKPNCWVEKEENRVEYKKFESKDDKDEKKRRSPRRGRPDIAARTETRDIDAYTIGSATFRFCCTDTNREVYSEAAAKRIGLELSICDRL